MLKKMLTAGALALFLASSAYPADAAKDAGKKDKPAAAKKHGGKAHKKGHCTKDGKELTTPDITTKTQPSAKPGHVTRRPKTCDPQGGTWNMPAGQCAH